MFLLWKTFFKSSDENNVVNKNDFAKLSDSSTYESSLLGQYFVSLASIFLCTLNAIWIAEINYDFSDDEGRIPF